MPESVQEQGHRLSTVDAPPLNLIELQQKLAQQNLSTVKEHHKVSTTSLPPMPTFDSQSNDHRRLSTISQPTSVQEYIQSVQQLPELQGQDFTAQIHLNKVNLAFKILLLINFWRDNVMHQWRVLGK